MRETEASTCEGLEIKIEDWSGIVSGSNTHLDALFCIHDLMHTYTHTHLIRKPRREAVPHRVVNVLLLPQEEGEEGQETQS